MRYSPDIDLKLGGQVSARPLGGDAQAGKTEWIAETCF